MTRIENVIGVGSGPAVLCASERLHAALLDD